MRHAHGRPHLPSAARIPIVTSYGRRGEGNILVIDHFGKARHRLLYCRVCKARFSEFKGTPFFKSKLAARQGPGGLGAPGRGMRCLSRPPGW